MERLACLTTVTGHLIDVTNLCRHDATSPASAVVPVSSGYHSREVSFALWARCHAAKAPMTWLKKRGRQEAVVIAITAADFPKVIARPIEFVALCNNDPGTCVIQSEMTFNRGRNFDCTGRIGGRSLRDR
jgi:hypothetical protein